MMSRRLIAGVIAAGFAGAVFFLGHHSGHGQRPGFNTRSELGSRVTGERGTRQAEVLRLQQEIDELESRILRLERQAVAAGQTIPSFTITEAEAAIVYAEKKLAATLARQAKGEASDVDAAADRLRLARAQGQLELATAARTDGRLALESEIAYAQRRLIQETQKEQQLARLVAKGYASSAGWDLQKIDVALARKTFDRAKARLELFGQPGAEAAEKPAERVHPDEGAVPLNP